MVWLSELSQGSSSSSSTHDHIYDVFLSFRGLDTRHNFVDHLHKALIEAGVTTFLDDEEIETGLSLKPELESAIKASRASIIVLSQNYASSTWCLDELVLILDQKRTSGHVVIPIFYHVEPTDVRKQQRSFGNAMAEHKKKMEMETNAEKRSQWAKKMELWNKALIEVADLKGKNAKDRKETELIEEIVTDRRLGVSLSSTLPTLIGMNYYIRLITLWLKDGSSHTADILTILGMGGIGKTSLAKYVFALHCREFQRSSFIGDINRKCAEQFNGLLELQKQICGDISKTRSIQVHDVSVYTSQIENALARKKVILVLDGVDSLDHLEALLGKKSFHPGSKIIITTQNTSLVNNYVQLFHPIVQPKHAMILLKGLDETYSQELLCLHAFKCNGPKKGHEEDSKNIVKYCKGYPLALEVLGKSLRDRDVAEWEDNIERLKEETDPRITKVLQMSFDSLPSKNDKELFKHISCFFVGKDRESTETILKACGIHTVLGIRNLIDRCLLLVDGDNKLMMHQLLQEMGRDVVRQESPEKPWKRSRLWYHEESFKVLKQKKGKGNILGLALDMRKFEKEKLDGSVELKTDALSKMDNLKLLELNYVQLNGPYKNFPEGLRWLCMHGFPLEYMPLDLHLENLVGLDMSYSNLVSFDMSCGNAQGHKKWQKLTGSCSKDKPFLRSLKILNLSFCKELRRIGGFIELPLVERLILANCIGLIEVCESIEQCNVLDLIDLSYCNEVGKLLRTIGKLKKVTTLKLDGCSLGESPIESSVMESPEMLKANNIGIHSHTSSSSVIVESIPRDFRSFVVSSMNSLACLSLKDNKLSNDSFPMDFSSLSMLKVLYLDGNDIISLPGCVKSLPRLEILSLQNCDILKTLEHPPRTLNLLVFDHGKRVLEKVVFDREMSPIMLMGIPRFGTFVEGMMKVEDMADVEEEVLRSLGWSNLDFTEYQLVGNRDVMIYKVQMVYEFGIFSTMYKGTELPNWISDRWKGASISFTIPPSRNKLRGLNFCYAFPFYCDQLSREKGRVSYMGIDLNYMSWITITNITKNRTWLYHHQNKIMLVDVTDVIYLSHWMFGKNEMEDGDQITISISDFQVFYVRECGVGLVYDDDDDGNTVEEENALGYYKSWNHIIGGDLSGFQTTTPGEYYLNRWHYFGSHISKFVEPRPLFRAYPQSKST